MSAPEPDILRRGQAIFDRLRGANPEPESEVTTEPESETSPPVAVVPDEPTVGR